jgi:integrase
MLTNDQHFALELAIMAALTTIDTKYPGRLKTIHKFEIDGPNSNFSFPKKGLYKPDVLLHVPAHITKNEHFAEGVPLKKSRVVDPKEILTWYRNEALPLIVTHKVPHADLRRPTSLFGGLCIDTIRRIWRRHTAAQGLFITPHMCRHLLASLLFSRGTAIELIAELLGDKVATVEKRYVFVDRIRKIREVMEVQAELFRELGI